MTRYIVISCKSARLETELNTKAAEGYTLVSHNTEVTMVGSMRNIPETTHVIVMFKFV